MAQPFEVGGTYRNRDGEYEVAELDGPRMVIRYHDGRRIETTVKLQKRIRKNIRAEEEYGSPEPDTPSSSTGGRGGKGLPKRLFQENLDDIFIAYAFSYVEEVLPAVEDASPDVEAVIVQPYYKSRIVSARNAMLYYKQLTGGRDIPILFTPQTRHQDQAFEYGARLLDLCHEEEGERVRRNVDAGRWLVWDKSLYARNYLIVETPIKELSVKPPIEVATNLLRGATQGQPTGAVSIPSPKILDPELRHLLEDL